MRVKEEDRIGTREREGMASLSPNLFASHLFQVNSGRRLVRRKPSLFTFLLHSPDPFLWSLSLGMNGNRKDKGRDPPSNTSSLGTFLFLSVSLSLVVTSLSPLYLGCD